MYIVDFAKNLFRKANAGVIVYLVLNVGLYVSAFGGFSALGNAIIALLLYFATICVALSPIGEWILRTQTGCKKIKRADYLERLMPLFEEVYGCAKAMEPSISDRVKLYMNADMSPNAFATGRRTICITKGFMSYTDEQIKGTLAHEFAHLAHKDTDLLLLIQVGNFLVSAIFVLFRIFANILVLIFATGLKLKFVGTFLTSLLVNGILTLLMWLWTKAGLLLVMHSSRENEYEADAFAFALGYGNDLCVVLDSIDGGEATAGRSLWAQLHSSHPDTNERIARLQKMGAGYNNSYGHDVRAVNANPELYGYSHGVPPVAPPPAAAAAFVGEARGVLTREPEPPAKVTVCRHCGGVVYAGDAFCGECGQPHTPPPPPAF